MAKRLLGLNKKIAKSQIVHVERSMIWGPEREGGGPKLQVEGKKKKKATRSESP